MRSACDYTKFGANRYSVSFALLALVLWLAACGNGAGTGFDGCRAFRDVQAQVALGPRVVGTTEGWAGGDWILRRLGEAGWQGGEQRFEYRGVVGRNILSEKGSGPLIILGAHYDSRPQADRDPECPACPVPGANDGASGVAVLLELARILDVPRTGHRILFAFFDAEDRGGIDGWPFSVGAEIHASGLLEKPEAMLLLDMIGDSNQTIYWERNSDSELLRALWTVAERLGYREQFIPDFKYTITDDHLPYVRRGIPSVDIIDFDYPEWHTTGDTSDKVKPESLLRVGRVVQQYLYSLGEPR